ncbi:hypothetical protein E4U55_001728 [Claviceps digitariae]|nr:hypothetical protein E4U55_001728 [Claviceps digitariae]
MSPSLQLRHRRHMSAPAASTTTTSSSSTTTTTMPMPMAATEEAPARASYPHSQIRRMTSFTQRLRGNLRSTPSTAALVETLFPEASSAAAAENKKETQAHAADKTKQTRPRSFYVPTHAAASFARTVSPLSPMRIEAKIDEDEHDDGVDSRAWSSWPSTSDTPDPRRRCSHRSRHSVAVAAHGHGVPVAHVAAHTRTRSTPVHIDASWSPGSQQSEYAAFLADAEATERAARARAAALRKRMSAPAHAAAPAAAAAAAPPVPCHAPPASMSLMTPSQPLHGHVSPPTPLSATTATTTTPKSTTPKATTAAAATSHAHRHSTHHRRHSTRSTATNSFNPPDSLAPLPPSPAHDAPNRPPQPKTLGRRLSEYFKPPLRGVIQGRVCLSH